MKRITNHLSPERSITLKVHLGPGKTGSSSIQVMLDQQRELLAQHGVYVPQGVSQEYPGHHMIPFTLLGRPLSTIGAAEEENLAYLVGTWFTDAIETGCGVMVISAEDISLFDKTQWRAFGQCLIEAQAISGIHVSALDVYYVRREMEAMVRSAAQEQYKNGATLSVEDMMEVIRPLVSTRFEVVDELPNILPFPTKLVDFPFEGGDLLRRWCAVVLGDEVASHLPESALSLKVNVAMADSTYEELRMFNMLNTPPNRADKFSALTSPETEEDWLAFERLKITRWAFAQRDFYFAEMNRLAYQLSQLEGASKVLLAERDHYYSEMNKLNYELSNLEENQ